MKRSLSGRGFLWAIIRPMAGQRKEILAPPEKRGNRLVIDWPDKEVLLDGRDFYILEYLGEEIGNLIRRFPEIDLRMARRLAVICLNVKYMTEVMQKISPISLKVPITVEEMMMRHKDVIVSNAKNVGDTETLEINLWINLYRLSILLENGEADLVEFVLAGVVHEFAHMVYYQETDSATARKRFEALKKQREYFLHRAEMSDGDRVEKYLSLDVETRARLWELSFYNHYFPESRFKKRVIEELERGRKAREENKKSEVK